MKRVMLIVLFAFAAICLALLILSYHDARVGANKVFHGSGPVTASFVSIHPSRAHGIWIFWRMHFARKTREEEMAPGDVALWYLRPFRHVEFTKDM